MCPKINSPRRAIDVPNLQREIMKRGGVILCETTAKRPEGLWP